jgi:hypothetical protein
MGLMEDRFTKEWLKFCPETRCTQERAAAFWKQISEDKDKQYLIPPDLKDDGVAFMQWLRDNDFLLY